MATNSTYLLVVQGISHGVQHIHTLHFRQIDPLLDADDLIDHWLANASATYRAMFDNDDFPVQLIKASEICGSTPLPAPVERSVLGAASFGTTAKPGEGMPSFVACNVKEKGTLAGKTRQGRFFIGGLYEGDCSYNALTPAYLALVQAYCTALTDEYITGTPSSWQLVVHSRLLASVPGTDCQLSSNRVASLVVNPAPTTMRSRKLGHGA